MIQQICYVLTALRQYLHQAHLLAKGNGYAAHLLLNELYDRVNEDIDRVKELAIGAGISDSVAFADASLKGALQYLRLYSPTTDLQKMLKNCLALEKTSDEVLVQGISFLKEHPGKFTTGLINCLEDLDERRLREVYLLNTQL